MIFTASLSVLLTKFCSGDKIEKNGMGGKLRERDHLGEPGVDGRIILRWIFRKWDVGMK